MNLWNAKYLEPPPIATYKTTSYSEIQQLHSYFKEALAYFNNQQILEREAALLSRCIYRMKLKFRSDKGLKSMEKLNRALLQFKYLNLCHILDDFYSLLPKTNSSELHLPTRNMLDFILIRLQGTAFLMCRVIDVAQIAASNMGSRICIGHFWKVALIMLGIVSRIWIICKNILKTCCNFYRNILPMRKILKNIVNNWLPGDYIFPDNLEKSLDIDCNNILDKPNFGSFKSIIPVIDVIENSDIEECSEYIQVDNENNGNDERSNQGKLNAFEILMKNEDFGEVVCEPTKQQENIISSDSEDNVNIANQIFDLKEKKNVAKGDNYSKKRKRKKKKKTNKDNLNIRCSVENCELEEVKIIRTEMSKQKCLEIKRLHSENKFKQNTSKDEEKKVSKAKSSVFEDISSLKELKLFMINQSKHKNNQDSAGFLGKIDKLQWNMLRKTIKKFKKRVSNNIITETQCLIEVNKILRTMLN